MAGISGLKRLKSLAIKVIMHLKQGEKRSYFRNVLPLTQNA